MQPSVSGHLHGRGALFLLVLASLAVVVTMQDSNPFTSVDCQSSGTPAPAPSPSPSSSSNLNNSTFWSNVVALLDALPSAAAPSGFASISRGNGTSRAFVRGICRGDALPADCAKYLRNATMGIQSRCNRSSRRAGIWYDKCFVSYADTNASTSQELQFRSILYNIGEVGDKGAFENTYYALMSNLTKRVVNGSGTTTSSSSSSSSLPSVAPMFATGEAVYDAAAPNGTMYGLLQCMRDRTPAECEQCLQDSVGQLPSCCYGHQGGVVLGYNCNLRVEIYTYYDLALDAPPPQAPPPSGFIGQSQGKKRFHTSTTLAVALPVGTVLAAAAILGIFLHRRKAKRKKTPPLDNNIKEENIRFVEPGKLSIAVLRTATNNFSEENKLGEGGFGEVFKGTLEDGEEIAVKRLSHTSSQGFNELKNELVLAAKLKHRNLVQLLGVCLQEEKLLAYEYMPTQAWTPSFSVAVHPVRRRQLDWSKRFGIICGIARGLLYLHEESRLKVIHRDLKPSNVLLDAEMNPKISDFGLARAFSNDQSGDITRRPVGTLGYMSPEYAYWGNVSTKSDMFSFGVIVIETVTGRRNNSPYDQSAGSMSVLSHVWDKWRTGATTDLLDPALAESQQFSESEVVTCIEVGLLCVQENPADRPDACAVLLMLSSATTSSDDRRVPARPAFVFSTASADHPRAAAGAWSSDGVQIGNKQPSTPMVSDNEVTITELQPR